ASRRPRWSRSSTDASTKRIGSRSLSGWWRWRSRSCWPGRSPCGFRDDVRRPRRARTRAARRRRRLVRRRLGAPRPHPAGGDRVGLSAFAGSSYILSPLWIDGCASTLYLDALAPDVASQGGTGLAPALRQGGGLLQGGPELADRVLVVFTGGEAHDSLRPIVT